MGNGSFGHFPSGYGTMEFSKRFFHGSLDLSPISQKMVRDASSTKGRGTMAVMNKYRNRSLRVSLRLRGDGYHTYVVKPDFPFHLNRHWYRNLLVSFCPSGITFLCLGWPEVFMPTCYQQGKIGQLLLQASRPKDDWMTGCITHQGMAFPCSLVLTVRSFFLFLSQMKNRYIICLYCICGSEVSPLFCLSFESRNSSCWPFFI